MSEKFCPRCQGDKEVCIVCQKPLYIGCDCDDGGAGIPCRACKGTGEAREPKKSSQPRAN